MELNKKLLEDYIEELEERKSISIGRLRTICNSLGYDFLEPYGEWHGFYLMRDNKLLAYSRKTLIEIIKQALRENSIASLPTNYEDFLTNT
ncbi:MAG: hypothetical protein R3321_08695 [Nitrososphaeraceae archaeon]|nr:hypothetical protein [Nitrososphaeraceae archaeon]